MSPRRLLIVATAPVTRPELRASVPELAEPGETEVRVVAPAARLSPLEWLANDEDAARSEAAEVADEAARAVGGDAAVESEVGDTDPVQAAEDALRTFPADELVVVTRPEDEATWLERSEGYERLGVPVRHVVVPD